MSDLVCERCGYSASYADAYIADRHRSCDGCEHEWVEQLDNSIDIITG